MTGNFIIDSIKDGELVVNAHAAFDSGIIGRFYLPPLNRASASDIQSGDVFFGVLDEKSGFGALLVMINGHDFKHAFDYNITVNGNVGVSGEMQAGTIKGSSPLAQITLSTKGVAAIAASMTTGEPATDEAASIILQGG